jgi:hypothetical protein
MAHDAFMQLLPFIIMGGLIVGFAGICGWMFTTWLRVKNGYPLEISWGTPLHPQRNAEIEERVKLLTQENAQLRAEIGSVKDRLATVERIVTDGALRLDREIEGLRGPAN